MQINFKKNKNFMIFTRFPHELQIWVAGYLESETNHHLINNPEIRDIFDQ